MRGWWMSLVMACAPPASQVDPTMLSAHEAVLEAAARVGRELDCATDEERYVCPASRLPGAPFELPDHRESWFGLQFVVRASQPITRSVYESSHVALLRFDPPSGDRPARAGFAMLDPSRGIREQSLLGIAGKMGEILRGDEQQLSLPGPFVDLLDVELSDVGPVRRDEHGWVSEGEGAARFYRIPDLGNGVAVYAAFRPVQGGGFLALFPELEARRVEVEEARQEAPPPDRQEPTVTP